ncbi:hypothetical protein L1887_42740 [Cichorium endivia]|nr:hypothetical protein L1887_42740 [Cichorium endivia]
MRVPSNPIAQALLETLGEPMLSTSLIAAGQRVYRVRSGRDQRSSGEGGRADYSRRLSRPAADHRGRLNRDAPEVIREGVGDVKPFLKCWRARPGHGSRREIEAIIEAGRVSVDGKIATLGDRVEIVPGLKIRIDGHLISVKESAEQICRVLAYYKPEGELCTRNDPEAVKWNVNTRCGVFGQVDENKLRDLSRGVQLEDGPAAFKTIKFTGGEGINQWRPGEPSDPRPLRRYSAAKRSAARWFITELDLTQTNYLRELVGLTPETTSKVAVEKDRRRMKANQIRRGGEATQPGEQQPPLRQP